MLRLAPTMGLVAATWTTNFPRLEPSFPISVELEQPVRVLGWHGARVGICLVAFLAQVT